MNQTWSTPFIMLITPAYKRVALYAGPRDFICVSHTLIIYIYLKLICSSITQEGK